jgi:chorismate synthase
MIRFLTAGESHGPAEVTILEGIPAGLKLSHKDIQEELDKRRFGAGRGGRAKIEGDQVKILSGVRFGKTIGSPIALVVENQDFANWKGKMDVEDDESVDKESQKITTPRPGHTDLSGIQKYHLDDFRTILERSSARETIMRVAVGAVCKKLLKELGLEIASHTVQIGGIKFEMEQWEDPQVFFDKVKTSYDVDPEIRCIDPEISEKMKQAITQATIDKDTLGGVVEIIAHHVPVGLGSHVHWDRKLDALLAQGLMSIPSVKVVEVGTGIENSNQFGSKVHDEIFFHDESYYRNTNRAGGVEGGISNGEDIILRVYHKPISTLGNPLRTVDIKTKEQKQAHFERSDICVVPRAGVIAESMVALILSQQVAEKFGGDSIEELKHNFEGYKKGLTTK